MQRRNARLLLVLAALIIALAVAYIPFPETARAPTAPEAVTPAQGAVARNIIMMVPDGFASAHATVARWYKNEPLHMDAIMTGGVRTYNAQSILTDSAPAASAFATGHKIGRRAVSILPDEVTVPGVPPVAPGDALRPVATILEAARLLGKSTGLVVTHPLTHATPAAFAAHAPRRGDIENISEQQVYGMIDVVLGGGRGDLLPADEGGIRNDGENLMQVLRDMGYTVVDNPLDLHRTQATRLWGLFAPGAMAHDWDRDRAKEPSLAEMTRKAIGILSRNPTGFFLMVEGSQIDSAAHANDPLGVVSDTLAFDDAVGVVLDYARKDGSTLVIIAGDHGTGGMSIGRDSGSGTMAYEELVGPLKAARMTGRGLAGKLDAERSNIREAVRRYYGIDDLTDAEVEALREVELGRIQRVMGPIVSRRSRIGWTTTGHTGDDLFLYSYGPGRLEGLVENSEIGRAMARAFGVSLDEVSRQLFVRAREEFESLGATVVWDDADPANPVVVATKGRVRAELPVNKNLMYLNGETHRLPGVVVAIAGTSWVPRAAVELFGAAAGGSDRPRD